MVATNLIWKLTAIFYEKALHKKYHRLKHKKKSHKTLIEYDYPLKTRSYKFGFFSSRLIAEQFIVESRKDEIFINCLYRDNIIKFYVLKCYETNIGREETINIYVYLPDGSFYDGSLIEESKYSFADYIFEGREKSSLRFKQGDLVEYWKGGMICLGIINHYSGDKERIQENLRKGNTVQYDMTDDSYVINYFDEEGCGQEGQTPHDHIFSFYVFEPKGFILDSIRGVLNTSVYER